MIRFVPSHCLLLILIQVARSDEPSNVTPNQFLENWANSWANEDVDLMMSFYEDSEDLVAISSSGEFIKGAAAVRKMCKAAFRESNWERALLRDLEIRQDGDTAWATFRFTADFTFPGDPTKMTFASRGSVVLHRVKGEWKIVLEHFSPIKDFPRIQPRKNLLS
jgi:uncharacterized protein (TIGR02246 family)